MHAYKTDMELIADALREIRDELKLIRRALTPHSASPETCEKPVLTPEMLDVLDQGIIERESRIPRHIFSKF